MRECRSCGTSPANHLLVHGHKEDWLCENCGARLDRLIKQLGYDEFKKMMIATGMADEVVPPTRH